MQPKHCAVCGQPMDYIRGGVSKRTGAPYNAFWACKDKNHKQPKPTEPQQVSTYTNEPSFAHIDPPKEAPKEKVDWDSKDRQSVAQTAMKSAADIIAAIISAGPEGAVPDPVKDLKAMANELYKEMLTMKKVDPTVVGDGAEEVDIDNLPF